MDYRRRQTPAVYPEDGARRTSQGRQAREEVAQGQPVSAKGPPGDVPDDISPLQAATWPELIAEITRRTSSFLLVTNMDARENEYTIPAVEYGPSYFEAWGLSEFGRQYFQVVAGRTINDRLPTEEEPG